VADARWQDGHRTADVVSSVYSYALNADTHHSSAHDNHAPNDDCAAIADNSTEVANAAAADH
jgi:hypothetical protein